MAKWTTTCFGQYGSKHAVVHLAIKNTYVTQLFLTIYNFQVVSEAVHVCFAYNRTLSSLAVTTN
jgi:hypothetical protein